MRFLVNAKRGTRRTSRTRRRTAKRKLHGAALAAHLRKIGKRSRTGTARRAGKQRGAHPGGSMAKRRRRRAKLNPRRRSRKVTRHNPRRRVKRRHVMRRNPVIRHRRRRGFRRNPGFSVKGLTGVAMQGLKDGAAVVVGKTATRMVSNLIPVGSNVGIVGALKQLVVAVGVGTLANKFVGPSFGRMVVAGGFVGPIETALKMLNVPILTNALGAYPLAGDPSYAAVGSGSPVMSGMGAYVDTGLGDSMGDMSDMGMM